MNPLVALIIAEIVKQVPALAIEMIQIFNKEGYTDQDVEALKLRWRKPVDQYYAEASK